jgi:hypothetical protein
VAVFQPGDALAASWARFAPAWGDPRAVAPITDPSLPSLRREGCARLDWFRQECTGYAGAWVRAVPDTPDLDGDGVAELTLLTLAPNPWNDLLGLHQPSGRVDLYDAAALGPQTSGAATRATVASPPEPVFPNGFQQGPREAAWADVDGDGARELVVAAPGDGFFAPFGAASQNGRLSVYPAGALGGGDVAASAAVADVWGESGWGLGGGLVQARLDDGPSEDLVTRLARGPWGSVGLVLGEELARGDVSPGGLRLWGTILGEAWAPLRDARVLAAALTPDAYDDLVVVVGEPGLRAAYIFLRTDGRAWGERSIADADRVIRPDAAWFGDPLASELGAGACAVDGWLFLGDPAAPGLDGQARAGAVFGWAAGTGGLSGEPSLRIQHDTAGDRLGAWLTCGGAGAAAWVAVGVEAWRDPESPLTAVGAMGVLRARGPDG